MKSTDRFFPTLFLIAAALLLLAVAMPGADKPDGTALYKQKCSMCHAPDGKGYSAIGTPDFTSAKWQASKTDKEIAETIKNGKTGTAMQGFGDARKQDEIRALVERIRSFNSEKKNR